MQHVQGYTRSHCTLPSDDYLLQIALEATRATFAGRFDGCGGAMVQYRAHRPMKEVHGFSKSHYMPPLGEHLLQ